MTSKLPSKSDERKKVSYFTREFFIKKNNLSFEQKYSRATNWKIN